MLSQQDFRNLARLNRQGWFGVSEMQRQAKMSYGEAATRIDELVEKGHLKRHEIYPYMVKRV